MIHAFSNALTFVFDILVLPFAGNRGLALAGISLLAGVAMIFVFKATSRQDRVKAARDLFKARILEMRLYQDDLGLIFKALWGAIASNGTYLRVSARAILVLVAFVLLVFIQLDQRFGVSALDANDTTLLTVTLKEGADVMTVPLSIDGGNAVTVDALPVRVPPRREITWRLRVSAEGTHDVTVTAYDTPYTFPVVASNSTDPIGRTRAARSMLDAFIHIGLPTLPQNAPLETVRLTYPSTEYSLFGWRTHWLVVFIVWSFIGAAIPKFLLGIEV